MEVFLGLEVHIQQVFPHLQSVFQSERDNLGVQIIGVRSFQFFLRKQQMRARAANLDKAVYLPLFLSLFLCIHSTDVAFVWTSTHHYFPNSPVNLWVMLLEPSKPEDDVLFPEVSDCEGCAFCMSIILENCVYNFHDQTCPVVGSINIED